MKVDALAGKAAEAIGVRLGAGVQRATDRLPNHTFDHCAVINGNRSGRDHAVFQLLKAGEDIAEAFRRVPLWVARVSSEPIPECRKLHDGSVLLSGNLSL